MAPVKVEMGSGYNPQPGFLHVEVNPNCPDVDVVSSVDSLPFADGSVDEVRAVDVLEHFSYWDTDRVLAEWARILRPGGRIFIQVPEAEEMMRRFLRSPKQMMVEPFKDHPPIVSIAWRIMGGQSDGVYSKDGDDWRWNAHYAMFSKSSLRWYLERHGFKVDAISVNPFPNIQTRATKL